jgi:threonyl-tRNA synthetase
MVYRDEQSGELSGLSRVLCITQDDAHVFCRENQIEQEAFAIWDIINELYGTFGFTKLTPRFSRYDPEKFEKYLGSPEVWKRAEDAMLDLFKKRGVTDYIDGKGEAAIYGPKIDFIAHDALGREHQVGTIQLDFNQPENFDLNCINEKGEKERVVMIHAAIMGSLERFLAVYIEHVAGVFPLWLAPVQVKVLPVSEKHVDYGQKVLTALKDSGLRAEIDDANESLGKKIRTAKQEKVPYLFVVGDKEVEGNTVTVENRTASEGAMSLADIVARLKQEYAERR